ncbi:MAG: hypothetical protein FWE45_01985 [Firmicutes bacterium]|nr:hypothetical protein [Bacillota bacterium]
MPYSISLVIPLVLVTSLMKDDWNPSWYEPAPVGGNHYSFVFANATIPVVQASLVLWYDATPETHFLWYGRRDTFDRVDQIAERFTLVGDAGQRLMPGFPIDQIRIMSRIVRDLYAEDSNNTFTLYTTDYAIVVPLYLFWYNRIPERNFNIVLLEDGLQTNNEIRRLMGGYEGGPRLNNATQRMMNTIRRARNGNVNVQGSVSDRYDLTLPLATLPNVTIMLQNPVTPTVNNPLAGVFGVQPHIMNRLNIKPNSSLMALTNALIARGNEARQSFADAMFGNAVTEALAFDNAKPTLVITTSSFQVEEGLGFVRGEDESSAFEVFMNKIVELYGTTHNLVYKGHPAWPVLDGWDNSVNWRNYANRGSAVDPTRQDFENRVAFLDSLIADEDISFSIIPCQLPMDMIMLFFNETPLYLGGLNSSLYLVARNTWELNEGDARLHEITTQGIVLYYWKRTFRGSR